MSGIAGALILVGVAILFLGPGFILRMEWNREHRWAAPYVFLVGGMSIALQFFNVLGNKPIFSEPVLATIIWVSIAIAWGTLLICAVIRVRGNP